MRALSLTPLLVLVLACGEEGDGGPGSPGGGGDDTAGQQSCDEGETRCAKGVFQSCGAHGSWTGEETCEGVCDDVLGCLACSPGTTRCADGASEICAPDGSGYEADEVCDPELGMACDESTGRCTGACSSAERGNGLAGCDFFAVEAYRSETSPSTWPIVALNPGSQTASVEITRGGATVKTFQLGGGETEQVDIDYEPSLIDDLTSTVRVADFAYRVRSDRPIVVYQLNTLDPAGASLDVSALLPLHRLGTDAVVATYEGYNENRHSQVVVVATEDGTSVDLAGTAPVYAGAGIDANGDGTVSLDAGDGLSLVGQDEGDLTGMLVDASAPVLVIGANRCASVPADDGGYCDHLQEPMWSSTFLGTGFHGAPRPLADGSAAEGVLWRVFAVDDGVTVGTTPEDVGLAGTLASRGDFRETVTTQGFSLTATGPVLLVSYGTSQSGRVWDGPDPELQVVPPDDHFGAASTTWCPAGFDSCQVSVVADSAQVEIDGAARTLPDAAGDWFTGWFEVGAGVHEVTATGRVWAVATAYETYGDCTASFAGTWDGPAE